MKARLLFLFCCISVCLDCQAKIICQGKDSIVVVSTLDTLRSGQINIEYYIRLSDYDDNAPSSRLDEDVAKLLSEIEQSHSSDDDETGYFKMEGLHHYYDNQWEPIGYMLNLYFAKVTGGKLAYSIYKKYFNPEGKINDRTNLSYWIDFNCDGRILAVTIRIWRLLPSEEALYSVSNDNCIRFFEELTNSLEIPKWDGTMFYRASTQIADYLIYW